MNLSRSKCGCERHLKGGGGKEAFLNKAFKREEGRIGHSFFQKF